MSFPPISIDRINSPEKLRGKATAKNVEGPSKRKEKRGPALQKKRGRCKCGASSRERREVSTANASKALTLTGKKKKETAALFRLYFFFLVYPLFFSPFEQRERVSFRCSLQRSLVPSCASSNECESIARFGGVFNVLHFSSASGGGDNGCPISPFGIIVALVAGPLLALGTVSFASHEQDDITIFA